MKLKYLLGIIQSRGVRNLSYRSWYMLQTKTGRLAKRFPTRPSYVKLPFLEEWKNSDYYIFNDRASLSSNKVQSVLLREKAEKILTGNLQYFSAEWHDLGKDWNWHVNPITGFEYDHHQHWTQINELNKKSGDIKFVWEASRFCFLYDIVRYDYHFDLDHSEFVVSKILDWIEKNPLNCGPNYKCSQEISLRVLNWLFALNFYKNSTFLTEDRWNTIIQSIYWQINHVYEIINFSRYTVRNNHAITETMTLFLMGLIFPTMPDAKKWRKNGKKWFEQEIKYQVANDGTFIQDSMNYHRVLIQLLTIAISISDKNGDKLSEDIYENAHKALNFLYQCQDEVSGWMPNYGSNDGALFFPLSNADYRDYRPQLDALHVLLTGRNLYNEQYEDALWFGATVKRHHSMPPLKRKYGIVRFEKSGYFLIREKDTLTFMRCGKWNGKQGCTDELHLDIWHNGENVLLDGGSYSYNTTPELVRYFSGTESHNTVMIGDNDQMMKGPRFVWMFPPTILCADALETDHEYVISGQIVAFKHMGKNIAIKREIRKKKGVHEWCVSDCVQNCPIEDARQLWHSVSSNVVFKSSSGTIQTEEAFYSSYYGKKEPCTKTVFIFNNEIKTKITIR